MAEISERNKEQAHLDSILGQIDQQGDELARQIAKDKAEAKDISAHFYDDIRLDFDDY